MYLLQNSTEFKGINKLYPTNVPANMPIWIREIAKECRSLQIFEKAPATDKFSLLINVTTHPSTAISLKGLW